MQNGGTAATDKSVRNPDEVNRGRGGGRGRGRLKIHSFTSWSERKTDSTFGMIAASSWLLLIGA